MLPWQAANLFIGLQTHNIRHRYHNNLKTVANSFKGKLTKLKYKKDYSCKDGNRMIEYGGVVLKTPTPGESTFKSKGQEEAFGLTLSSHFPTVGFFPHSEADP